MTVLIGVYCKDGVVIGADSSATFAAGPARTIEQPTEKIFIVGDCVIIAGTGSVGLGQRFSAIVQKAWDENQFRGSEIELAKQLSANTIADFSSTHLKTGMYGALLAFPCTRKPYLCEFDVQMFQPEFKTERLWYVSMGSGQAIADPFLALIREVFWSDGPPTVQEGVFAVTWALDHAIRVNPGGVNGPSRVAVLENTGSGHYGARLLSPADLDEHRQNIDEAKKVLRGFRTSSSKMAESAPDLPNPPTKK
jgi:20S proteasome alpha/beta subunit